MNVIGQKRFAAALGVAIAFGLSGAALAQQQAPDTQTQQTAPGQQTAPAKPGMGQGMMHDETEQGRMGRQMGKDMMKEHGRMGSGTSSDSNLATTGSSAPTNPITAPPSGSK